MDPTRPLHTPVAEVRAQAPVHIDEYGEAWMVIDGIETKVPNIQHARRILEQQDKVRVQIRADLDEQGLRFNPDGTDREEQVEITLEDGTVTTVGLLKPGDANYLQIQTFPDADGLFANAEKAQSVSEEEAAKLIEAARIQTLCEMEAKKSPVEKIAKRVMKRFKRALKALGKV